MRNIVGYKSGVTARKLSRFSYFAFFCRGIFHWRVKIGWHIAFKFEALWHCTDVNRQEMTWQQHVATAGAAEVSLYKRPGSAAGIASFLGWGEDATAVLRSSEPTSALIFSGNDRPMSPVYTVIRTGRTWRPLVSAMFKVLQLCRGRWVYHEPQTSGK